MATMKFEPKHNVAAYLNEYCVEASGYEEMIRFLLRTKYVYAMCAKPIIYERLIKKFWRTAEVAIDDNGQKVVRGFISRMRMIEVSENSVRHALRLGDNDPQGLAELTLNECKEVFMAMGHPNHFPKQQFFRARVFKHWKLICYIFQHCLSKRSAGFDSFPSELASPIVALATNKRFNMAKWIMNGFIFNLEKGRRHKYLMYPRFLQLIINEEYPDIKEFGLEGDRLIMEHMNESVYQRLAMVIGAVNLPLFDYIRDVANDDVNMDEEHYHLIEGEPIDPNDLEDKDVEDESSESESEDEPEHIEDEENESEDDNDEEADDDEFESSESESDEDNDDGENGDDGNNGEDIQQEQNDNVIVEDVSVDDVVDVQVENDVIIEGEVDAQAGNLDDDDLYPDMNAFEDEEMLEVAETVIQLQNVEVGDVDVVGITQHVLMDIAESAAQADEDAKTKENQITSHVIPTPNPSAEVITKVVDVIELDKDEGQSQFKNASVQVEQEANINKIDELKEENAHYLWMIEKLKSENEKLKNDLAKKEAIIVRYRELQYKNLDVHNQLIKAYESLADDYSLLDR